MEEPSQQSEYKLPTDFKDYIIEYVAHSQGIDLKDKLKQGLFQRIKDKNSGFYKEFRKKSDKQGPNKKEDQ